MESKSLSGILSGNPARPFLALAIRQGTEILADWRYVGLGMMVGQTYPAAASGGILPVPI